MVREYIVAADIGKSGSCHLFRHTMATLMLENGCDVRFIQAMLGHAKLETTQIYTQVSIRKLKEIHEATHPAKMNREEIDALPPDEPPSTDEKPTENASSNDESKIALKNDLKDGGKSEASDSAPTAPS